MAFMLAGRARIPAVEEHGCTFVDDVSEGGLWNFPSVIPHSIRVTNFLAHSPKRVFARKFGVPERAVAKIPNDALCACAREGPALS